MESEPRAQARKATCVDGLYAATRRLDSLGPVRDLGDISRTSQRESRFGAMNHLRHFGMRWRQLKNIGFGKRCPICHSFLRNYVVHGQHFEVLSRRSVVGGIALRDYCPVCYSLSRTRLMSLYLAKDLPRLQGARVLHFGPELGLAHWIRGICDAYVPCDLNPAAYREIEGIRFASLDSLPFSDRSFDVVICSHVLEHVRDDRIALREILRVLDADGRALLLVPEATDGLATDEAEAEVAPSERERRFGQVDHFRLYERADFVHRVHAAGFAVQTFDAFEHYPDEAHRLELNPLERLRIGVKRAACTSDATPSATTSPRPLSLARLVQDDHPMREAPSTIQAELGQSPKNRSEWGQPDFGRPRPI